MTKQAWLWPLISAVALPFFVRADDGLAGQRKAVEKGLEWLAKIQAADGHWGTGGHGPWGTGSRPHSTNVTARAGMALLMQGSTVRRGKYSEHIRKTVAWLLPNSQDDGLIRNGNDPGEANDYMEGHGFAMLFLASAYPNESDSLRRRQLKYVLTRAVDFCGKAQTELGGWTFVSAKHGGNLDVGELAVSQMQGLAACRDAGIAGTEPIIAKGLKYLEQCTAPNGGIVFCLATRRGQERPNLTAAALVSSFSAGQYDSALVKKWLKYCASNIPAGNEGLTDPSAFGRYYYAQVLHMLGDNGYARLFPASRPEERLTWSKYKKHALGQLIGSQGRDGSWKGRNDQLLMTTMNLTILQLDSTSLPIYRHAVEKRGAPAGTRK
jgi:hypothetical protein